MAHISKTILVPSASTVQNYKPLSLDTYGNLRVVPPAYTKSDPILVDGVLATGTGILHTLVITMHDSAPLAGSLIIYDNTAASGTIIHREGNGTAAFKAQSILLDCKFNNGIYVDFTTVTDIYVSMTYLLY